MTTSTNAISYIHGETLRCEPSVRCLQLSMKSIRCEHAQGSVTTDMKNSMNGYCQGSVTTAIKKCEMLLQHAVDFHATHAGSASPRPLLTVV